MSRHSGIIWTLVVVLALSATTRGQSSSQPTSVSTIKPATDASEIPTPSSKDRLLGLLSPSISDGLDFNLWGWLGGYRNDQRESSKYYDAEVGLGITKSFNQTVRHFRLGKFHRRQRHRTR